jgi:hypothetical protein
VIQPLEIPSSPEVAPNASASPAPASQKTATGKAFSAVHAEAVAREKPSPADVTSPRRERVPVPDGETWAATKPGAHYARIITGPRTGQYINLTHGERRGETFTIEHRDGKKLHVYAESGTEVLIKPSVDASATTEAAKRVKHSPEDLAPKGERWAPVEGHNNYADILEGPRNGLYVNISGGVRDGMAFQIVKKGDRVYHVYGTGKDRQMIQVEPRDDDTKRPERTTAATGSGGTTPAGATASDDTADAVAAGTGGTAAPSSD